MTDLKKWIFRYVINDVTYYYGTRRGGIIGFETDVMNFEDTVTHVIYDPDRIISEPLAYTMAARPVLLIAVIKSPLTPDTYAIVAYID